MRLLVVEKFEVQNFKTKIGMYFITKLSLLAVTEPSKFFSAFTFQILRYEAMYFMCAKTCIK